MSAAAVVEPSQLLAPEPPPAPSSSRAPSTAPSDDLDVMNEEWALKDIDFHGRPVKIITQNRNGPCSFLAICNILLLRGDVQLAPGRESVTYAHMAQVLAEYLLARAPDVDVGLALEYMPLTTRGMDLNPDFTSTTAFRPAGNEGALALFAAAGIPLVHGWLSDPHAPEHAAVARARDYDTAVALVARADHLTRGALVGDAAAQAQDQDRPEDSGASGNGNGKAAAAGSVFLSPEERASVEDAIQIRQFLDTTASQLTYPGLFALASALPAGEPVALFRASHLAVLYKPAVSAAAAAAPAPEPVPESASSSAPAAAGPSTSTTPAGTPGTSAPAPAPALAPANALYALVTDAVFARERAVVWEALGDVDGQTAAFVDGGFAPARAAGGDFAGLEHALDGDAVVPPEEEAYDGELAKQLQAEEDLLAHRAWERREEEQRRAAESAEGQRPDRQQTRERKRVKKNCLIM